MGNVSRRDLLKTGLLAPAAVAVANGMGPMGLAIQAGGETHEPLPAAQATPETALPGAGRERLLLDFGWRFHFGNADDPTKDFGFGTERIGNFQKTGNFMPAGAIAFDDSDWRAIDLPHDWAIELPFQNDPALASKDSIRWGGSIRRQASAGIGESSSFAQRTRARESRSSSMAHIARRWWSSTAFTSDVTAAVTIRSVSM
jgi:hypothetical protein